MSAPQTNIDKQKRRHRGPLIGMIAVVTFALTLLFFLMADTADTDGQIDIGPASIDGNAASPVDSTAPATPPAQP